MRLNGKICFKAAERTEKEGCLVAVFHPVPFDCGAVKTFDVRDRQNLVHICNLIPLDAPVAFEAGPELSDLASGILAARAAGRPVILFYGAHVIKCGLSRFLIDLAVRGLVTHLATNGAGSIHDFELAFLGGTSECVPMAIENGSFGMWEQTGGWMNEAVRDGYGHGAGYGEALARYVDAHPERFPYREDCVFWNAYSRGVPVTCHITVGTDIIHQHPKADFAVLGGASGVDFKVFVNAVKDLEGGVFLNFGSAITGPEVFLKALSISRNNGFMTERITTANFDLLPLGDYRSDVPDTHPHYYYRPRKNIVNRPTSRGGRGYHICGNHKDTLPALYRLLTAVRMEVG